MSDFKIIIFFMKCLILYSFLISILLIICPLNKISAAEDTKTPLQPIEILRFDIEKSNDRELIKTKNIHKWIENYLKENLKLNTGNFKVFNNFVFTGEIIDFKIQNKRIDKDNNILTKELSINFDFAIQDNNGFEIFSKKFNFEKFEYYFSRITGEIVFTEEENIKVFAKKIAEKIIMELLSDKFKQNALFYHLVASPVNGSNINENYLLKDKLKKIEITDTTTFRKTEFSGEFSVNTSRARKNYDSPQNSFSDFSGWKDNERLYVKYENKGYGKKEGDLQINASLISRDEGTGRNNEIENIYGVYTLGKLKARAGQIMTSLSSLTLNKNIEGLNIEYSLNAEKITAVVGRLNSGKDNDRFERWGHGARFEKKYSEKNITLGINHSYIWDKTGIANQISLAPEKNQVLSADLKYDISKDISANFEYGFTRYWMNKDFSDSYLNDYIFTINVMSKINAFSLNTAINRFGANFKSLGGSNSSDQIDIIVKGDYNFNDKYSAGFRYNNNRDNLKNNKPYLTRVNNYNANMYLKPFIKSTNKIAKESRGALNIDLRKRHSSDNSLDNKEITLSAKIDNKIEEISVNTGFTFTNENDYISSANDRYSRIWDLKLNRNWSIDKWNIQSNIDFTRRNETQSNENNLNGGVSIGFKPYKWSRYQMQYRLGVINKNIENSDSRENTLSLNADYSIGKKEDLSLGLKVEYKDNSYEDSSRNYDQIELTANARAKF